MDFSLTALFVVPVGNTLPTTGSTESLTAGQFGIFKDKTMTAATSGNIGSANFIRFAQGSSLGYQSDKSDKIKDAKVKKFYKVVGSATAANEIWDFSGFSAKCEDEVSFTLRGHSEYLDTISFNGFTRSVTVKMPCCDCGADPCEVIANATIIDLILAKIAEIDSVQGTNPGAVNLTTFFNFSKIGTGDSAKIRVESKPITKYGKFADVSLNPFSYDRVWFRGWAYKGPATTVDFLEDDRCAPVATATLVQRSSFSKLTSDEVAQMEIDYFSYKTPYKHLYTNSVFNQAFTSYVTAGTVYDLYVLQFNEMEQDDVWASYVKEDERVLLAIPHSQAAAIETILEAYLTLDAEDESGAAGTTTTTTSSTTSTTTSTTTTLTP